MASGFSLPVATNSPGVSLALFGSYCPHTFLCLTALPPCCAETGRGSTPQPGVRRVTERPPFRAVFKRSGSQSSLLGWREPGSPQNCQCRRLAILLKSLSKMKPRCGSLQANLWLPHELDSLLALIHPSRLPQFQDEFPAVPAADTRAIFPFLKLKCIFRGKPVL